MNFSSKKPGSIAILIACVVLVGLAIFSMVCGAGTVSDRTGVQKNPNGSLATDGSCSILFPAGAGNDDQIGATIDQWIAKKKPDSPLKGMGKLFAQSGRSSNINPAYMASVALKESILGTRTPGGGRLFNPFGRKASASQPGEEITNSKGEKIRWYKFNSWEESIREEGPYLKRMYVDDGRTTVATVVEKYCPRTDCDTDKYIQQASGWMAEISDMSNGALPNVCNPALTPGTGNTSDIVRIAQIQLGVSEDRNRRDCGTAIQKYGGPCGQPWCAYFTTWVYQQAGYKIPKMGSAFGTYDWFTKYQTTFTSKQGTPQPGDIIVFNSSHIGIVESYANGIVHTIEGNAGHHPAHLNGSVKPEHYNINDSNIKGFGRWVK